MQPKFNLLALLTIALFFSIHFLHAQPGNLNTSFGDSGILKEQFASANAFNENATAILHLKGGKSMITVDIGNKLMLSRINADGTIDSSFANNGFSESVRLLGNTLLVEAQDGSYFVGGAFFRVAHFNADGTLDKNFGRNGLTDPLFGNLVNLHPGIAIQPDGKIILAGGIQQNQSNDIVVTRFNRDGSLDASFGDGGIVISDFGYLDQATAVAVQPDGKIVIAGSSGTQSTNFILATIRYNSDGTLDKFFGNGGRVLSNPNVQQPANALKLLKDGNILVASNFLLFKYHYDGSPDYTFGSSGLALPQLGPFSSALRSMEILADDKILVAGELSGSKREVALAQFNPNGSLDSNFGLSGISRVSFGPYEPVVKAMSVRENGFITVVGSQWPPTGNGFTIDYAMLQTNPAGFLDQGFGTGGQLVRHIEGEVSQFRAMAVQPDNKIIAGGNTNNGKDFDFIVSRYLPDGTPDEAFGNKGKLLSDFGLNENITIMQVAIDGKLLVGGNTRPQVGTNEFLFVRYNNDGTIDSSFGQHGKVVSNFTPDAETPYALALQPDGKFLAGGGSFGPQGSLPILARYNADGSLDDGFGVGGLVKSSFGYSAVTVAGIHVLPGGNIITLNRVSNLNIKGADIIVAQYNANGQPDLSFGNGGMVVLHYGLFNYAGQMHVGADGKITIGGGLDVTGINLDFALFRLNPDGTPDLSFGTDGMVTVDSTSHDVAESFSVQPDGKIVLHGETNALIGNSLVIVRFNSDGTPDSSFANNGKLVTEISGDELFTRSVIVGDNLYLAGSIRDISTYASLASFALIEPVKLICPADMITYTDSGICAALISNIDPLLRPVGTSAAINYNFTGATTAAGSGNVGNKYFNKGITTVTYTLDNAQATSCSFNISVKDTAAPVVQRLSVSRNQLWPANNIMKQVSLDYLLEDNCGVVDSSITVVSNDVNDANSPEMDWEIISSRLVRLRAEKSKSSEERMYTITIKAKDGSGNTTSRSVAVTVSNSQFPSPFIPGTADNGVQTQAGNAPYIKISSNPTRTYFTIRVNGLPIGRKATMRVINVMGMLVEEKENITAGQALQLGAAYQPGVYFIQVVSGSYKQQIKVIKQ